MAEFSQVFLLCLMAGCSICWFNTVCYVLCIRNFPANRALSLSLTISFNGVSAALYTLIANAINPSSKTLYLFLNALVPLLTSGVALVPILRQPPSEQLIPVDHVIGRDSFTFLVLYILAVITGLYLVLLNSLSSAASIARILLAGAIILLVLPLCLPGIVYAREWARRNIELVFPFDHLNFSLVEDDELELFKELVGDENSSSSNGNSYGVIDKEGCFNNMFQKERLTMLGEEHSAKMLVQRWDFWLYYIAYLCGGTIGISYSNNLGQIAQSLGHYSKLDSFVTLYSSCSFFGRLLAAAPDFLRNKVYFARTGWLAVALVPTPIAFFLLAASGSEAALRASTALIGLSSGYVFSAAVSITSELFGPNSISVNHNILITNIPIGSLLYGLLAAIVYDSHAESSSLQQNWLGEAMICMGRKCYLQTFIWWGCISLLGLVSSFALFSRTKPAYDRFERNRNRI
ncbi:protein NUCLEAR FUSION DEFECTIVE 4-like isoform X1 [Tripterygium wilfordii]|uniref:Protein NUCLEAR FUSION DEFECTIVE 4-like isoform X1 n=1 Tax=Tripterygium wilfordii TaxID=458696 RepID=A0A7J7DSC8_TRIWF|nr:protein NUCLEAR FUSION DEFECTIVE 4-like isoform X1 [Tripterygium wilfordii]